MAVLINADNEGYTYTSTGLPTLANFTVCHWWYRDTTAEQGIWCVFASSPYIGGYNAAGEDSNYEHFSSLGTHVFRTAPTGQWMFSAVTINGTSRVSYYANEGDTTLTAVSSGAFSGSSAGLVELNIGFVNYFGDWSRGKIAHFRVWAATLSQSELEDELVSATAVRTSNLTNEYRFANGALTTDSSGGGRTLSSFSFGTPTFSADPTFPSPGVNGTATGAFTFAGPASGTPTTPGTAATALSFTSPAVGVRSTSGTAATSLTFAGPAVGTVTAEEITGTAVTALAFTGSAVGAVTHPGVGVAAFTFAGPAQGTVVAEQVTGTAAAALVFAGPAAGVPTTFATAATALAFDAPASGSSSAPGAGTAATALAFAGPAVGAVTHLAAAATALSFTAAAVGEPSVPGTAAAVLVFAGPAAGTSLSPGDGIAATDLTYTATAAGTVTHSAAAAAAFTFTAPAIGAGTGVVTGVAATALSFTATVLVITVRYARVTSTRRAPAATTAGRPNVSTDARRKAAVS